MTASRRDTLRDRARAILLTPEPQDKAALTAEAGAAWRAGRLAVGEAGAPDRPARPKTPRLVPPTAVPRRRRGPAGRTALLHAVAHIELNAIDLAWDIVARFAETGGERQPLPPAFLDDWVQVAEEEARHFGLLAERLTAHGSRYGALDAHDGLWSAAQSTADDLLARLAIVPLVHEARGLDVTPGMIDTFKRAGDTASAAALGTIYADEIGHVRIGFRWFSFAATARNREPVAAFRSILAERYSGALKPPYNHVARANAGFARDFYDPTSYDSEFPTSVSS